MRLTTPESTSYSMSGIQRGIHSFHAWAGALAGSGIWDEFGRRWDLAFETSIMRTIWGVALKEGGGTRVMGVYVCTCSCVYRSSQSIPLASACSCTCSAQTAANAYNLLEINRLRFA